MTEPFKPEGYNSVSPYLVVNRAQKMLDLLDAIFGIEPLRRYETEEGRVLHAEFRIGDSVLMIADATEAYPPNKLLLHVYVPDVDRVFQKAIDGGCASLLAPKEMAGDPDRRGTFRDYSGNIWNVATQVGG